MTFFEFLKVLKRHLAILIIVALIGAAAGFAYVKIEPKQYSATATLLVSGEANSVGAIASQFAVNGGYESTVTASTSATQKMITVVATGTDEQSVINDANSVIKLTQDQLFPMYPRIYSPTEDGTIIEPTESSIQSIANEATEATSVEGKSAAKYAGLGLVGGLFIAFVLLLIYELAKNPVRSVGSVEEMTDLVVLDSLPANDNGKRLTTNIKFVFEGEPQSVCFLPASADEKTMLLAKDAASLINGSTLTKPISLDIEAASQAKDADCVVVAVAEFSTRVRDLEDTLKEISLAHANVIGLVYKK